MSFLIIGSERFAFESGETVLGGRGDNALAADSIAHLPPFAIVTHPVDGPTTIRALGALPVSLNGAALRSEPDILQHGDRIEVAGLSLAYGEVSAAGRTGPAKDPAEETPLAAFAESSTEPTASTGGRLIRLSDRSVHTIPGSGLSIGRDPSCGLALASKDVSRVHAVITPSVLGYTILDKSANGVWINGLRVDGSQVLGQRDIIRIANEDFRFEADVSSFEPTVKPVEPPRQLEEPALAIEPAQPTALLASIEVLSGPLKGLRFRVSRPTIEIGRGPQNDLQLDDESVSGRHASLVQRGNTWTILDLNSRNGTYVEGEIVRDQRIMPSVCEVQLGTLKLLFRAINTADADAAGTIGVIGITDERLRQA